MYELEKISRKARGRAARNRELHDLKRWRQKLKQCLLCGAPSQGRRLCKECGGDR